MIKDKFLRGLVGLSILAFALYIAMVFAFSCNRKLQIQSIELNNVKGAKIIIIDSCEYLTIDRYTGIAHKGNCKNHE